MSVQRNQKFDLILGSLRRTPIMFAYQGADLTYIWMENPPPAFAAAENGKTDFDVLPHQAAEAVVAAKRRVLTSGAGEQVELTVGEGSGARHYDLYLESDRDAAGGVIGVISAAIDVTDRRNVEARQKTLLRELSHRSKNLLAIVQSLATQTSRTARSKEEFIERFNGRLQSISRSQDLITDTDWRGARLKELVTTQVEPYVLDIKRQLSLPEVDYYLRPNAALHVGLALHELAAGSLQSGALSAPAGALSVTAEYVAADPDEARAGPLLRIVWCETGPSAGEPPEASDFSRLLLARIVPAAVGGAAKITKLESGLRYELTLARREFE